MAAAVHNLEIPQGASYSRTLTIFAGTPEEPVDLTGATFKAEIREAHKKPLAAEFACVIDADPTTGVVTFSLTKEQTAALNINKRYRWDIYFIDSTGVVERLIEGEVKVSPSISKLPIVPPN